MNYPSIEIQGNIITADLLDRLTEMDNGQPYLGQRPSDFALKNETVRDAIAFAYSTAKKQYSIIKERIEKSETDISVSDTRNSWMIPFFQILGYDLEFEKAYRTVHDQSFVVSHGASNLDDFPVNIITWNTPLDQRLRRYSTHAEMQLYLNATEHLYAFVSNGNKLRLLRDSTKLTALTYVEFDLELMMEEDLSADFSILYRLCHATRMPKTQETAEESLIEEYHLRSAEDGERIREKLGKAIIAGLEHVGSALLEHPNNTRLRSLAETNTTLLANELFEQLLKLVYRILFLLVIEERGLVFKRNKEGDSLYQLYYEFYSLKRLRKLAENQLYLDLDAEDLWKGLFDTFALFEQEDVGARLSVPALAGGIFSQHVLSLIQDSSLKNEAILSLLNGLSWFEDRKKTKRRVNYGALNVEEFGSVYEGLLSLDPIINGTRFGFRKGVEREKTGSHYTPDDLVKPLLEHALDPVMERKISEAGDDKAAQERAILSMTVVDTAAGSGHFLLGAARRMALRLAQIRTGDEQPSAQAQRTAKRDVIASCMYAVDRNEMAVELCKVALWLEAHDPGTTLAFLDHKVRWGDSLVGIERVSELREAIPDVAFKAVTPADKKENRQHQVSKNLTKRNRKQAREMEGALQVEIFHDPIKEEVNQLGKILTSLSDEGNSSYEAKRALWDKVNSEELDQLRSIANARLCGFFVDKTQENYANIPTTSDVRWLLSQGVKKENPKVQLANQIADEVKMFHWGIEFADVMSNGGFDVVIGNPPYLNGQFISGKIGLKYPGYFKNEFKPAKSIDLCGYFFRRNFNILNQAGRFGLIATNTIAQGGTREGGLAIIEKEGTIVFANPNINWPGLGASVTISLVAVSKTVEEKPKRLRNNWVDNINSYLSDEEILPDPHPLFENIGLSFQGSIVLGDGFVLSHQEAMDMIAADPRNKEVIFPYLIGRDVNSRPDQSPSRWVINFFDWPIEKAQEYELPFQRIKELVYPERTRWKRDKNGNDIVGTYALRKPLPQKWWIYGEKCPGLYNTIKGMDRVLVNSAQATKYISFPLVSAKNIFSNALGVLALNDSNSIIQLRSSIHNAWAWKYCSTLDTRLRYMLKGAIDNFPLINEKIPSADELADENESLRKELCESKVIGLTKVYNEFHDPEVTDPTVQCLRDNHVAIDQAVLKAYSWDDIELDHDFHEMEYLPENDRIRFTIGPEARKEVLKRLLLLNHERYEKENKSP